MKILTGKVQFWITGLIVEPYIGIGSQSDYLQQNETFRVDL